MVCFKASLFLRGMPNLKAESPVNIELKGEVVKMLIMSEVEEQILGNDVSPRGTLQCVSRLPSSYGGCMVAGLNLLSM